MKKEELLKALKKAEESRRDKIGLVAQVTTTGLTSIGAGALAANLTTITTIVTPTFLGSTTLGTLIVGGATVTTTTLIAPIAGAAVVVGAATYGLTKLVRNSGKAEQIGEQFKKELRKKIADFDKVIDSTDDKKVRTKKLGQLAGIYSSLLRCDVITIEEAFNVLIGIENNSINVDGALNMAKNYLASIEAKLIR